MDNLPLQVNLWMQRLYTLAQTGLAFNPHVYDRERYEELLHLAADMAATDGNLSTNAQLSQQLYEFWRAQVEPNVQGYVTPKVGIGAIVFNERDELLLTHRPSGYWLFPTGWADVGYSPAAVAIKEVREETGLKVTPQRLIAVYDVRQLFEHPQVPIHFYSLLFYCQLDGGALVPHPQETLDAGFFSRAHLPAPLARTEFGWVEHAWAAHQGELKEAYFETG